MSSILCSVATKGRYDSTLPMVLMAIANQTRLPDKLNIYDDNDDPIDMRSRFIFHQIFQIFNQKGLKWEVIYAPRMGQHYIHQHANLCKFDWVWRVDDDCVPEPNVLEILANYTQKNVGAVGGSILTGAPIENNSTGAIDKIDTEPNIQWGIIKETKSVDHLHCSFLYRAGVNDYALGLSRIAHREETLFTYGLKAKGYFVLAVPNAVSWHLKNPIGGIRTEPKRELFEHDEQIFRNVLKYIHKTVVVLDCGRGDHVVFSRVLKDIPDAEVFTCYPDIVPGRPLAEAYALFGDISQYNIYKMMSDLNWTESLEKAFRKMYL